MNFFNSYNSNLELPSGIIHGDLFRDNILFYDGEINAVIDFYFAGFDYFLFDLSIALNDWAFDEEGNFLKEKESAFLDGYNSVKPLSEIEKVNFKNQKIKNFSLLEKKYNLIKAKIDSTEKIVYQKSSPSVAAIEWIDPLMAAGNWVPQLIRVAGGKKSFW